MKEILVPCDFSFTARQAYGFALQVAERTGAEVHVVKVIDFPFSYESAYAAGQHFRDEELVKQLQEDAAKSFQDLHKQYGKNNKVHFSAIQGSVTNVILTFIDNEGIDLVIMGTNGATGMKEYFVGSNTEKIVRFSPVPVIAVRQDTNLSSITDIVVPTDTKAINSVFIAELKKLQALSFATLHLLLVSTDHYLFESNKLREQLDNFAQLAKLENYTLNLQCEDGKEKAIVEFAKEINADMIAMATHGRRGLSHLFIGSLAEDIVNHVNCPVWTYSIRNNDVQGENLARIEHESTVR